MTGLASECEILSTYFSWGGKKQQLAQKTGFVSYQQPGACALWDYPNSLPHGCLSFHQYSLSPESGSSYTHHTGHSVLSGFAAVILYEASAIFYSVPMVWVIQKSHAGWETLQSSFLLRGWGPTHCAFFYTLAQRFWASCLKFSSGLPRMFSQRNVERVKCMLLGYRITEEGYDR